MAADSLKLPPMAPARGAPVTVRLHLCWKGVPGWCPGDRVMCATKVDPEGIGLCDTHLAELRLESPLDTG